MIITRTYSKMSQEFLSKSFQLFALIATLTNQANYEKILRLKTCTFKQNESQKYWL